MAVSRPLLRRGRAPAPAELDENYFERVEASVRLCWPNLAAKHGEEGGVGFD